MNDSWIQPVSIIILVAIGVWVWVDAEELNSRGAKLSPLFLAILSFGMCIFGFPLYLLMRTTVWKKQLRPINILSELDGLEDLPEPDMSTVNKYTPWKDS